MLLRIAIGWHFLYEGLEKVETTRKAGKAFTAEPYLRFSTGPLAPVFRGLIPDVNSIHKLNPDDRKASWKADVDRIASHYHFDQAQRDKAQLELKDSEDYADIWFEDHETKENRRKYFVELGKVQAIEQNPNALSYERERAAAKRKDLDADRRSLIADLDARGESLRSAVTLLATPEQQKSAGPVVPPRTTLDWVNLSTMWGLVIMGVCLILGLFSPLAALAGAVFLGQIYLSMPPWPGLPANPMAEGHYFIVNKNLIEMLACLALACIPTGSWIGIDALLFGGRRRRRELARELAEAESEPASARSR
ncbi:DoxX family protein [Singulisphaera sp. Ch08]|uniref:DoxX family protein n=1 Tax=Singulisphaera sp. Ch08 TaxID=3120278 RepID=A0AAU7CFH0_9BACT